MQDYDKTTRFTGAANQTASSLVTIFDGDSAPRTIRFNDFGKNFIYFGRDPKNDLVLTSHLVSSEHGRFVYKNGAWIMEDKAAYKDNGSTNGLIYNNASITSRVISDGDFIRIDDGVETVSEGVCSCPRETSFTRGTILIKPSQVKNVTVGAYVYTTGDILPLHRALPGVNIRGIILSHSEDRITLLKYVGADFTSFESCAKIKDGWRFLTFQECIKLVKYREKLNIRLAEMKRKQIDNSLLILYQDERKELLGFQVSTRKVKKTLTCKLTAEDRAFALYMAKDLKIV